MDKFRMSNTEDIQEVIVRRRKHPNKSEPTIVEICLMILTATTVTAAIVFILYLIYQDYQEKVLLRETMRSGERIMREAMRYEERSMREIMKTVKPPLQIPPQPVRRYTDPQPKQRKKPVYTEHIPQNSKVKKVEYGNGSVLYQWTDENGKMHNVITEENQDISQNP